jgi:2-keto-4-pentenoate hydratase
MVYSPVPAVTADFAIPVEADVTVTLAPEITAPEWSVTVPTIAVSTVCAGIEIEANNRKREIEGNLFIIANNLLMILVSVLII